MPKLLSVKAEKDFSLYLKYSDGMEGSIKLNKLVERIGYKTLCNPCVFEEVYINPDTNDVSWEGGITICKDAIYRQLELKRLMKNLHIDIDKE